MLLVSPFLSKCVYVDDYDKEQANTCVYLSGAAYCGKENYETMVLVGPASGFVYKETLYDIKTDLQGYIGYLSSKNTIYVALRGSSSALNWLNDFEIRLVDYTSWPSCDCKVHNGFYKSVQSVTNRTLETVKILKKRFPTYKVTMEEARSNFLTAWFLFSAMYKQFAAKYKAMPKGEANAANVPTPLESPNLPPAIVLT